MTENEPSTHGGSFYASIQLWYLQDRDFRFAFWLTAAFALGASVVSVQRGLHSRLVVVLWTLCGSSLVYSLARITSMFRRRKRATGFLNPYLEIIKYIITFKANSNWKGGTFHFEIEVRPLRSAVEHFIKAHRWTGTGPCLIVAEEGLLPVAPPTQHTTGIWERVTLPFDKPTTHLVPKRIRFHIEAQDPNGIAIPYLSKTIDDQFAKLSCLQLRAILPIDYEIEAYIRVYKHSADLNPVESPIPIDRHSGAITWSPPKVETGFKYEIIWKKVKQRRVLPTRSTVILLKDARKKRRKK